MSYRQDYKRLRRARRQVKRQQQQLANAELDGIVGVVVLTLTGAVLLPMATAATATELVDTLWQGLVERQRQLEDGIQRVQRDWFENETRTSTG